MYYNINFILMARTKKTSPTLEKASMRLLGLNSIDPSLDFGNGISTGFYMSKINMAKSMLDLYNTMLSQIDEKLNQFTALEKELQDINEQVLLSVAARYGKNSNEYEKAGGVRKSERKRPTSKSKA